MIRPFLTARWIAWHVAVAVIAIAFAVFGHWQLAAYERPATPSGTGRPVDLHEVATPGASLPDRSVGQPVRVTGRYDGSRQLLVPARELEGRSGFHVVTPLRTAAGVVAVNRGWVSIAMRSGPPVPAGPVTVTGLLQSSENESEAGVDPLVPLPRGQVPYVSTVELQDALPYRPAELYDGYVLLTAQEPADAQAPRPVPPKAPAEGSGRWRNLAYAVQWWVFAAAAIFFWASTIRRAAQDRRSSAENV